MRVTGKIPFAMRKIALAAALASVCTQAGALVADGKFDGLTPGQSTGTGYFKEWTIGFQDDKGIFIGDGKLYFGVNGSSGDGMGGDGSQFLYFQMPLGYADNTYGSNSDPSWLAAIGKIHEFDMLLGSDSMGADPNFQWTDQAAANKTAYNAARIDYIADCSAAGLTDCNAAGYRSGGVGMAGSGTGIVEGTNGAGTDWLKVDQNKVKSGPVITGSAASIMEIATSLEYNLKNCGTGFDVNSGITCSGGTFNWVKEVGYEIQFKAGTFDSTKWGEGVTLAGTDVVIPGLLVLGDPHVSPSKKKFGEYKPPCDSTNGGCGNVPEPGTVWLLGVGLAAMGWYARRRKEHPARGATKGLVAS